MHISCGRSIRGPAPHALHPHKGCIYLYGHQASATSSLGFIAKHTCTVGCDPHNMRVHY